MRKGIIFLALALLVLSFHSLAQYKTNSVFNVLDAGNDNSGGIISNNATSGNLGNTTGQERGIAFRPALGSSPPIIYIARGSISTGDGRPSGQIGLAAIKLQSMSGTDFNPNTNPDVPSNYFDTGLIISGGNPANFSFIQAIFYEPNQDKVWLLDGTGNTARVWNFNGGSLGGAPNGGDISATAVPSGITSPFTNTAGSATGGSGRGIAVRVSGSTITVALGMGNHLRVWESTDGGTSWYRKFESSTDPDGSGSLSPFSSTAVRDVAFDENGDIWIVNAGSNSRMIHRYSFNLTGDNVLASENITLPTPSFDGTGSTANPNSLKIYKDGSDIYFIVGFRSSTDGNKASVIRYKRTGTPGNYSFVPVDGFGNAISASGFQDNILSTLRYKGSSTQTQPSGSTNALMYMSFPYTSSSDLTLLERKFYINAFVTDPTKNQTRPTSGVIEVLLPPLVSSVKVFDRGGTGLLPGQTNVPVLGIALATDRDEATISGITLRKFLNNNSRTLATDSEISAVKAYIDVNSNNSIDDGVDILIGNAIFSSNIATINFTSPQTITTTGLRILFAVDVDANANQSHWLALKVESRDDINITSIADKSSANYPLQNADDVPLPVQVTKVSAEVVGNVVKLRIKTQVESSEFLGFEIYRSRDNVNYVLAGSYLNNSGLKSKGGEMFGGDYEFVDKEITGSGKVYYRIEAVSKVERKLIDVVEVEIEVPKNYVLHQNYPNPFNPATTIEFEIPVGGNVVLELYNSAGQKVMDIFSGELPAGYHKIRFDGSNLASGVYFYVLRVNGFVGVKKMVLVK